jgi:hypothetical protein
MLSVGQKLYWVPNRAYHLAEQEVVIEKVGRKWATFDRYRIDINTLVADGHGYNSPGTCYLNKEIFIEERASGIAWRDLRQSMNYNPPRGVVLADILQAMKLLGIAK